MLINDSVILELGLLYNNGYETEYMAAKQSEDRYNNGSKTIWRKSSECELAENYQQSIAKAQLLKLLKTENVNFEVTVQLIVGMQNFVL